MTIEQITDALNTAGVNADSIAKLKAQDMLDQDSLTDTNAADLVKHVGLTLGMAGKVKKAFPSTAANTTPTAPAVAAPVGPISVVIDDGKLTTDQILTNLSTGLPEAIADAREKFGDEAIYVTNLEGGLDVEATKKYLAWKATRGSAPRFQNTDGVQVDLVSVDSLFNVLIDLCPLTGQDLVPGDVMLTLSGDQRLLLAFGVETNRVRSNENVDLLIGQVKSLTTTWKQIAHDLATAKRNNTPAYQRAVARLTRQPVRTNFDVLRRDGFEPVRRDVPRAWQD